MSLYDSKKENIDKLVSDKEYISYSELEEIVNNSKYYYSLNDKIAIIDYIEILIGFNKIRRLKLQQNISFISKNTKYDEKHVNY